MAKALQCPSCGTKTRLDALPDGASFRCEQCGQALKVPPGLGRASAPAAAPPAPARQPAASSASSGAAAGGTAPPAPRRRASRPTMTAGGAAAGAGGTAVLSSEPAVAPPPVVASAPVVAPPRGSGADGRSGSDGGGPTKRDALPLPLRVLAWLVALPLGLAIVGLPARKAGYLSSQKLLDVIVKSDITRFVPIIVIILLWALVSALLVTLFVEGGRRFMMRRRRKHADAASAGPAMSVPARKGRS